MGFKISWIAIQGTTKSAILGLFNLEETQKVDDGNEAPFSVACLPTGWVVLWANDYEFASDKRLSPFIGKHRLVAVQVHEGVMNSRASCFENGELVWNISHESKKGARHLHTNGILPSEFELIKNRLFDEQDKNDSGDADTDYIFDVPIEVAQFVVGFRHDQWKFDWGSPEFTVALAPTLEKRAWWQTWFKSISP